MEPPLKSEQVLEAAEKLAADAEQFAAVLDSEMGTPEHEHTRGALVRQLGAAVQEYGNGYAVAMAAGHELGMEYGRTAAKLEESEAAREGWRGLAVKRGHEIDRLTGKLLRRARKVGNLRRGLRHLRDEIGRLRNELEIVEAKRAAVLDELEHVQDNLTAHLITKGAELKAARKELRAATESNTQLRRRLRDSNLRKLTLMFGGGGMWLDAGSKVAEPVDGATDAELLEAIAGGLDQSHAEDRGDAPSRAAFHRRQAVYVLDALRNVER